MQHRENGQTVLSLAEAAAMTGQSKATIQRAIKAGTLPASRNRHGAYQIQAVDVATIYPDKMQHGETPAGRQTVGGLAADLQHARHRIEVLESAVRFLEGERDYLREIINNSQAERAAMLRLLPAPAEPDSHNGAPALSRFGRWFMGGAGKSADRPG